MVVLTIVTQQNGETIYFEKPIPKVHFIKLISCSLYNSWDTLKKRGTATLTGSATAIFLPGNYTLESLAEKIDSMFTKIGYAMETKMNEPCGMLQIVNKGFKRVVLDTNLSNFLGVKPKLATKTLVKRLSSPTTYFIRCDLIDTERNLFNGKRSDVLATFYVKGKPYEKVIYLGSPQQVLRDCSTDQSINSITISVEDESGELFDFKGFPLLFELELN